MPAPKQTRLTDVVSLVEHIASLGLRDLALTPRHLGPEIVSAFRWVAEASEAAEPKPTALALLLGLYSG